MSCEEMWRGSEL